MEHPSQEEPLPSSRWSKLLVVFSVIILCAIAYKTLHQTDKNKPGGALIGTITNLKTPKPSGKIELLSSSTIPSEEKWSGQTPTPTIPNPEAFYTITQWKNTGIGNNTIPTELSQSESWTSLRPLQTFNITIRTLENWTSHGADTTPKISPLALNEQWTTRTNKTFPNPDIQTTESWTGHPQNPKLSQNKLPVQEAWTQPKSKSTDIQYSESWNPAKPIPTLNDAIKQDPNWKPKTN